MTVEELYAHIGGDYDEAIGRLRSDALVKRFIVKFLDDTSCADVLEAWSAGDRAAAFEAAHTAKGVCANLALTELAALASEITEALRPGNEELCSQVDIDSLVSRFEKAYHTAADGIASLT